MQSIATNEKPYNGCNNIAKGNLMRILRVEAGILENAFIENNVIDNVRLSLKCSPEFTDTQPMKLQLLSTCELLLKK